MFTLVVLLSLASLQASDQSPGRPSGERCPDGAAGTVTVVFHIPENVEFSEDILCTDAETGEAGYMIERYVLIALRRLKKDRGLVYEVEGGERPRSGPKKVVRVAEFRDDPAAGEWKYWVNGHLSLWRIDNQLAAGVRRIEFRYVDASSR